MMEKIKENGVLIGVAVFVIIIIGFIFMSGASSSEKQKEKKETTSVVKEEAKSGSFIGSFATGDKDQPVVAYSFDLPRGASSTVEENGAYIVSSLDSKPFTKIYFSDERERKQTPKGYLSAIILPNVKNLVIGDEEKIGNITWTKAQSATMEWHVGAVLGGKWLVMVESYKKNHDEVVKTLESVSVSFGGSLKKDSATASSSVGATNVMKVEGVEGAGAN